MCVVFPGNNAVFSMPQFFQFSSNCRSAPPTRPCVDIDGADATLDVARSIVAASCLCLPVAAAATGRFWPEKSCGNPSLYL